MEHSSRPACIIATATAPHEPSRIARTGEPLALLADLAGPFGLRALRVEHVVLPAGRRAASPHAHTTREELVYVIAGRPSLWLDGALHPLAPGDAVVLTPGTGAAHTLINHGDDDAVLLAVASAAPDDACFYPHAPTLGDVPAETARAWAERARGPHDGTAPATHAPRAREPRG